MIAIVYRTFAILLLIHRIKIYVWPNLCGDVLILMSVKIKHLLTPAAGCTVVVIPSKGHPIDWYSFILCLCFTTWLKAAV